MSSSIQASLTDGNGRCMTLELLNLYFARNVACITSESTTRNVQSAPLTLSVAFHVREFPRSVRRLFIRSIKNDETPRDRLVLAETKIDLSIDQ